MPLNATIYSKKLASKNRISVTLEPKIKKVWHYFWKAQHTLIYSIVEHKVDLNLRSLVASTTSP